MANFISEEAIQKALSRLLLKELKYDKHIVCQYDDSPLGRKSKNTVLSLTELRAALQHINQHLPAAKRTDAIEEAIREIRKSRKSLSPLAANREVHQLLKDGYDIKIKDKQGKLSPEKVVYIDFFRSEKNHFMVVEELPILGKKSCRTDLLLYINGIPLVFIELKNSNIDVRNAYTDNLFRYKRDIPLLFNYNAFIILSNGDETKVGSYTATWEHYNEWKRVEEEDEAYNPEQTGISLERVMHGMCSKKRLLDLLEHFIVFESDKKIVAKNHQYIGVNNAIASFEKRLINRGKLGVFWHTQGSGKSFSMIFFTQKILQKFTGDFTFLIVTDRITLDKQIYSNFFKAAQITEKDKVKANSREDLQDMLKGNKKYIFTIINKFGTKKGEEYPLLTERSDIIVLVDEAHRSQYNTFAQNMRKAMPNANYIAFTGTPLLDANETTKKWFGEYISEYNFAQSIEDGATVPLYYENRVPKVRIGNEYLNSDLAEIVDSDNLTPEQEEKLKKQYANELEVIKRDSRLEEIAKDIVAHFPYREYQGKAMVISVDKYTTVKMYDKVQQHWKAEKRKLNIEISECTDAAERDKKRAILDFMRKTEMYVVISKEADEDEKFAKQRLNIKPHRAAMEKQYGEEKQTLRQRFMEKDDPFRLVFLCSKWLTGFDSPTISTLYLDKPMQNHTLMQTIARANRVAEGKECGMVIDYYGVFENLEAALEKYGRKHNSKIKDGDTPVKKKEELIKLLDIAVSTAKAFLKEQDCEIDLILNNSDTFDNIKLFREFANTLSKTEELKKEYYVHENALRNIYKATQPDTAVATKYKRTIEAYAYLRSFIARDNVGGDYGNAVDATRVLLDESIYSEGYEIKPMEEIDLLSINFKQVEQNFKDTSLKYLAITDFKDFLKKQLERLLRQNTTRINLAEKLQEIIDKYNSKTSDVNRFFEELQAYAQQLRQESIRAQSEGLTEEELQIFDLLYKEKLTKAEKQKVKLAAQDLLTKLKAERDNILVVDWHKNQRQQINVEQYIMNELFEHLEGVYDIDTFRSKSFKVYDFLYEQASTGQVFAQA